MIPVGGVRMELSEFRKRVAHLRSIKNVSAREMSLSIGLSANHINKIENGKILPSMTAFFDICDYLEVSPNDFFDSDNNDPDMVREMVNDYKRLDKDAQANVAGIIKGLARDSR
jgi:transcriptional regulator with XRE-family HTH domain